MSPLCSQTGSWQNEASKWSNVCKLSAFYMMHSEIQGMYILSVKDSLNNGFFLEKNGRKRIPLQLAKHHRRRTNRGWDGWSRKNEGRCSAELSSEGHTSRGELGAQRSHSEIWGWTSLADLQLTKMTPFYGEQAGREARVDMRKQCWSSRHSGDRPGVVTRVMQRGGGVWEYQSLRQNKSVDSRRGERSSVSGSRTG